jgi:hypothetical protein
MKINVQVSGDVTKKAFLVKDQKRNCANKYSNRDEMGGTCSTYLGRIKAYRGFDGETWGKETTWKTQV